MTTLSFANINSLMKGLRQRSIRKRDVGQMRKDIDAFGALFPVSPNVEIVPVRAGERPAELLIPANKRSKCVLLYLHGGGFVMGSIQSHRQMASHLSAAAKITTLITDYRLAPEHPFPAAIDDTMSVYQFLLTSGMAPHQIVVVGDSAGGGLSVSLMMRLKEKQLPLPGSCVVLSPWVDLALKGASWIGNAQHDDLVNKDEAKRMVQFYLNGKNCSNPMASPVYADLSMLPSFLIQVGSREVLLDDAVSLHGRAQQCGVTSDLEIWDDMPHVWHFMSPVLEEGRMAINRIAEFVNDHLQKA
jgi:phosphinothricin tripeptide acetyl hydrolase